jgi:hypothetical protein
LKGWEALTDLDPLPEQRIRRVCGIRPILRLRVVHRIACVQNDGISIIQEGNGTRPHAIHVVPLIPLQRRLQEPPADQILGHHMTPFDRPWDGGVWVVLVKEVVVAFIIHRSCNRQINCATINHLLKFTNGVMNARNLEHHHYIR